MATLYEFTSEIRNRNVSKQYLYEVSIVTPPKMRELPNFTAVDNHFLSMWCSNASTPLNHLNTNTSFLEDGVRRKYAFDQDYQNLVLTFYLDQDYQIKNFFDMWKTLVVPQRRKFSYPDDYTAESLVIEILNSNDDITYTYEYSRVYPVTINSVELSASPMNAPSTFSVEFAFEECYYTNSTGKTNKPNISLTTPKTRTDNVEIQQNQYTDQLGNIAYSF